MDEVLELCRALPVRALEAGETLLSRGTPARSLYVLESGAVEVRQGGVVVAVVTEPGSFLGEVAALLDVPHGADVVATQPTVVRVIEGAAAAISTSPALTLAIARLLAQRLRAVTTYLSAVKQQYATTPGHLSVMDQVLAELATMQPREFSPGSDRDDVPDY